MHSEFGSDSSMRPARKTRFPSPSSFVPSQAAAVRGIARVLPLALLVALLGSVGALVTSAVMLVLHFPVHTVFCFEGRSCYPNFFLTTWLLTFATATAATAYQGAVCVQQRHLRLRKSTARAGAFLTLVLWLVVLVVGFLPARVVLDKNNVPSVPAHGMLRSSLANYRVARAGGPPALVDRADASRLIWTIGDSGGGGSGGGRNDGVSPSRGAARTATHASIYRARGDAHHFRYMLHIANNNTMDHTRGSIVGSTGGGHGHGRGRDSVPTKLGSADAALSFGSAPPPRSSMPRRPPQAQKSMSTDNDLNDGVEFIKKFYPGLWEEWTKAGRTKADKDKPEQHDGKNTVHARAPAFTPALAPRRYGDGIPPYVLLPFPDPTAARLRSVHNDNLFFRNEARLALATTAFVLISFANSSVLFLLLTFYPFI
ncbi:hypothetical protein SPI_04811 [Niveomyces insectorum RCEF 264]|uniref:Uncharacterized protein n=1 Tax=Niveomyces insectorum RCEF 264 TaxID=1081102 RepID=A0A167UVM9_9HYPO|nr:hypothetical protein SPI_04811 [Niveomyces insectorum RCEF 264]